MVCFSITSLPHIDIEANCPSSIVSSLEDRDYPTDDSCIDLDLNFMDDAEADDAWEAMKAAAGCGNG